MPSSTELDALPAAPSGKEYHNLASRELSAASATLAYSDDDEANAATHHDRHDMTRMGKVQELRRTYRPLSTIAFTVILQGTWEVLMTATTQGLVDGGLPGLLWSYVWTFIGFGFVTLSLAEMASMAPTSGGQYHWVSEFAPSKYQRFLSYFTGWMSFMSWQAGTASGPFLVGTLIQGCAIVAYPDYEPTNWQGTLMVIAVALIVWGLNVYGAHAMPLVQNVMLIIHVLGFLAIIIVLWVLSPRNTAKEVFTHFTNDGGWQTMGLSLMVGQISSFYALICSDAAAHISEEIKDAAVAVPRSIIYAYALNGGLGFIFLITYLFTITDIEAALEDWYPHIWVFRQAVNDAGVIGLNVIPTVLIFAGTVSYNLSTSRQTWSFARDNLGNRVADWSAKVDPNLDIPVNSVTVTTIITIALSLINIGSDVAFNAIISLNVVSLMITYTVSIGCVLWRRIYHPETLPQCRWNLGKWGVAVNLSGFLFSIHAFFWCFWPNTTPTDAENFNWASVMFVAVAIFSTVYYYVAGRHTYKGPVVLTEGWKGERSI